MWPESVSWPEENLFNKGQGHIIFLTKYKTTYSFGYNLRVYYSVKFI